MFVSSAAPFSSYFAETKVLKNWFLKRKDIPWWETIDWHIVDACQEFWATGIKECHLDDFIDFERSWYFNNLRRGMLKYDKRRVSYPY